MSHFWMIGLLLANAAMAEEGQVGAAKAAYVETIQRMEKVVSGLDDITYTMHKTEMVAGRIVENDPTLVKFLAPMSVYMRVGDAASPSQEVLYKDGWNEGKLRVSLGGWAPTVNLHPESRLVMRKNRHSIRYIAPQTVVDRIAADARRANGRKDVQVADMGIQQRLGESARCFEVTLPKGDPEFYAALVEMCVAERTGLLVTMRAWQASGEDLVLVEDYGYEGVQTNTGLTSADFSPDNVSYNF
jgi:hypothetical protein